MAKKQITQEQIDVARREFDSRGGKVKKLKIEVAKGYHSKTHFHHVDPMKQPKISSSKAKADQLRKVSAIRRKEFLTTL